MSLLIATLAYISVILLLLRIYCRLTLGRCDSKQDMSGKTVLITGASAGIGKATALELARRNARVLLACRNLKKSEKVKEEIISTTGNTNIKIVLLDLGSFESVRKCAKEVIKTEERLDVLINNAGAPDLLKKSKPSRIINVASEMYLVGNINFNDLAGFRYSAISRHLGILYYRSKLANILFTTELARRLKGSGVTANALHPGLVISDIFYLREHPVLYIYRFFLHIVGKSIEEGAQTSVHLAVHPAVQKTTGKYFRDCQERRLFGAARDKNKAKRLFDISERIVGGTFEKGINTVY